MSCPTLVKSAVISALAGFCLVSSAQDHELTTDVVVIGGGISGLSSAMSVLDHGGKVVVLEKLPGLGGAGNYFEGAFAADSDYKRRNGLKEPTADQVYKDVVRFYNYRINAVVLRTLINESGPAMDWIETKGYKFQLNKRGKKDRHMAPDGFGAGFIKLFYRDIEKKGGTILLETPAQKLIQNDKGEVIGVEAKNYKGEKVVVKAKAVILATGGFPGNQEMLKKYVPEGWQESCFEAPALKAVQAMASIWPKRSELIWQVWIPLPATVLTLNMNPSSSSLTVLNGSKSPGLH